MSIPKVVIVGRPNVGKSSVFNWLAGKRIAIVDDFAGVTRDRITQLIEIEDRHCELVDTGGIGITDTDDLTDDVEQQITYGIDQADLLLFVVDALSGIAPLDEEVTRRLRQIHKPIVLVANKSDSPKRDSDSDEFYRLGFGEVVRVSTKANRNKAALLQAILDHLPPPEDENAAEHPEMKIAIVGRRNVGKSTFINSLVDEERMIVSEVPGTTRDSVDIRFELDGKSFVAIDTPGLRRRVSVRTDLDFYGMRRAQRSIRQADVVLLFFDAAEPISKVDKQLCSFIMDSYKPCIFVVNKWDLYHGKVATEEWAKYLRDTFGSMWHVPIAFITGQTGKNAKNLLNHAQMLFKQSRSRVTTGHLNGLLKQAFKHYPPPVFRNKRPKIYYATQVGIQPPTIVMICNQPDGFSPSYRRYLLGVLRDQLSFGEVPIKMFLQRRKRDDERDEFKAERRTTQLSNTQPPLPDQDVG
jgi:GTP-binding protein